MFPISHSYITNKVTGKISGFIFIGSALPDIRVCCKKGSLLERIHAEPKEIFAFIKEKYPEIYDLGLAIRLHCGKDKGADHYSDDMETGYALLKGREILPEVGKLINDFGRNGEILSHNFIEAALELKVQKFDGIDKLYGQAISTIEYDKMAECLADYLKMDKKEVFDELENLFDYFSLKNLSHVDGFAEKLFPLPTKKRYGVENLNVEELRRLIIKSQELIQDSYEEFFDSTIKSMKKDFEVGLL